MSDAMLHDMNAADFRNFEKFLNLHSFMEDRHMLVLARKVGETIQLDDNITIVVVGVKQNRVKLAIQAPRETRVLRGELIQPSDSSTKPAVVVPSQSSTLVQDTTHANSSSRTQRRSPRRSPRSRQTDA